jgi:arabinogalactan oligomer/maltooligosaccharide transport system permease protein
MRQGAGGLPYLYLAPALTLLAALSLLPNLYSVYLAFTNFSLYHYSDFQFVGLRNFERILASSEFWVFGRVFGWTVAWAAGSVLLSVGVAMGLALPLNNPHLAGRDFYRTLFIVPWAVPAFISVLMWQGLLNTDQGAVNAFLTPVLRLFDSAAPPVPWLNEPGWARFAVLAVNVWLSFPFMLTVCLGALQSIPSELYEAAAVDGASPLRQFRSITLPLLRSALLPVLISSFAYHFNNFTAIFLLTKGGPALPGSEAGATDILLTYSYKLAFEQFQYGLACAYSILIFFMVATLSGLNFRLSGAFEEAR